MTTHKRHLELLDERLGKLVHRLIFAKPEEAAITKDELDVLKEVKGTIDSMVRYPPHVVLAHDDNNKWWMRFRNGKRDLRDAISFSDQLCAVDHPVLEELRGDRCRLVLEVSTEMAKELREVFEIPMQPAPLDATESLVRAAYGLNGAAIELGSAAREVARELKTALAEMGKR